MPERAVASISARLELPVTRAVPGGGLVYVIINTGTVPVVLGAAYGLERRGASGWEDLPVPYAFPLWGLRLQSGSRREMVARIPEHAQAGRHRLRVRLPADRDPHPGYEWVAQEEIQPVEVSAEFDVRLPEASG
jgi:hypothetical protein